jgi:hypothetical protein
MLTRFEGVAGLFILVVGALPSMALVPAQAPALPPPDPTVFTIVAVDTAQELADACWNLTSDTAIVIAAGTYDLGGVAFPNGVDGRLTVGRYGAPPISNIQIRGATGHPEDVVLLGRGMLDSLVPFGFQIFTATDVVIADLSLGEVYYHAVAVQNDQGADRVRIVHCRLHDTGQQIVKGTAGGAGSQATVEFCELFYTVGAVHHPDGSPPDSCYTNGVDAINGDGWIVRDNLLSRIRCQDGTLAGPAVLLWQGSRDSVVERNTFLDCGRGVSLGLISSSDHTGGIVRNNFFRWDPDETADQDVAIHTTSPGSQILHNTILSQGVYSPVGAVTIEVRWATGVEVRNNLMDGDIWLRDGAAATMSSNLTTASPAMFVDEATGDLHLTAAGAAVTDQVDVLGLALDDFDAAARPTGPGLTDIGGDEVGANHPLFADGFESGSTDAGTVTTSP